MASNQQPHPHSHPPHAPHPHSHLPHASHPPPHPCIQPQPWPRHPLPTNSATSGSGCPLCGSLRGNRSCVDGFCKKCCQNAATLNPGRKLCNEHKHQLNPNTTQHVTGSKIHIPVPQHAVLAAPPPSFFPPLLQQQIDPSLSLSNTQFPALSASISSAPQQQIHPSLSLSDTQFPSLSAPQVASSSTPQLGRYIPSSWAKECDIQLKLRDEWLLHE